MKIFSDFRWNLLAPLALVVLMAGCQPPEAEDPHAGHNHAANVYEPYPSESESGQAAGLSGDRCGIHSAAVELCFLCDETLRDQGRLWCRGHDRYEDRCWDCHPELRDANRLYCDEHGLYEDECFYCHPELESTLVAGLSGDRCDVHSAAVELCFLCDETLRDQGRLWCRGHDRYEDRCWDCHPELRDANRLYCDEHGLYEDECFYCHPELENTPRTATHEEHGLDDLMCVEHGVPEAQCGICRPQVITQLEPGQSLKLRLPTVESAQGVGVQTGNPTVGQISDGVECYAELAFDQNRMAQIVAPVSGIVQEVLVDLGNRLQENQPVARLWSAGIAEAMASAVLSHQNLERERKLRAERVTSEKDLQEAEAAHRTVCQQVRTLGFSEEEIDAMADHPDEPVLLDVRAPFAGEITERLAVRGELVETGRKLFTLVDRSNLWAMLNIPESTQRRVAVGQAVELQFDSLPGRKFIGKLTWISPEVDDRSRMVRARAEVPNPEGLLKARMFARARILTRDAEAALILPSSAIQQVEGQPLVFVKLQEDLFDARRVALGARRHGFVEIVTGLSPREEVVVTRGFALKSHLLISRLGAGCAHE